MNKEDIYDFVVTLTIVQVNKDEICVVGEGLKQTSVKYINRDDVLNTMKDNMANSASLKWQYFASEQGVFFSYPTLKYCSDTYDPRFRFVHIQTECSVLFFVCLHSPRDNLWRIVDCAMYSGFVPSCIPTEKVYTDSV